MHEAFDLAAEAVVVARAAEPDELFTSFPVPGESLIPPSVGTVTGPLGPGKIFAARLRKYHAGVVTAVQRIKAIVVAVTSGVGELPALAVESIEVMLSGGIRTQPAMSQF